MKQLLLFIVFSFISISSTISQNSVGVINNTNDTFNGYTLFTAHFETFLINNCIHYDQEVTDNGSTTKKNF